LCGRKPRRLPGSQAVVAGCAAGLAAAFVSTLAGAAPVEYVKVCSLYGQGFYYQPGTDICIPLDSFYVGYVGGMQVANGSATFPDGGLFDLTGTGTSHGFQGGWTHLMPNGWQAGVSADYSWSHFMPSGTDFSTSVRGFGSVSVNAGPTLPGGVNPYFTGGVAYSPMKFTSGALTETQDLVGGTIGGGIRFPLGGSLSASFQYNYYLFEKTAPFGSDGATFNPNFSALKFSIDYNFYPSGNGLSSLSTYLPANSPPPQYNFTPYIGGQLGLGWAGFDIKDPDGASHNISGTSWAAGGYAGIEAPTEYFPGFSTRWEASYLATGAKASIDTLFGDITKSICGYSSIDMLLAVRPSAIQNIAFYAGGGAGFLDVTAKTPTDITHEDGIAFSFIAGAEYEVYPGLALGLRNTVIQTSPLKFGSTQVTPTVDYFGLTATYRFNIADYSTR